MIVIWKYVCIDYDCGDIYKDYTSETSIIPKSTIRLGLCSLHRTKKNIKNLRETVKRKRREKKMEEERKNISSHSKDLKSYRRNPSPEQEKTRKTRICLKCDPPRKFMSEGPWNRVCGKCNYINEHVARTEHASNRLCRETRTITEDY